MRRISFDDSMEWVHIIKAFVTAPAKSPEVEEFERIGRAAQARGGSMEITVGFDNYTPEEVERIRYLFPSLPPYSNSYTTTVNDRGQFQIKEI